MRVLMVGATGAYAGMVLPELVSRGVTVRALVQDKAKSAQVLAAGEQHGRVLGFLVLEWRPDYLLLENVAVDPDQ